MMEAVRWYAALTLIGAGGLLPASLLFGGLRSGGVLYARPLGLLIVAEIAWLLSGVGRVPYGLPLIIAATVMLWGWSAGIAWRYPARLRALRERISLILVGEVLFVALFALWAWVRSFAPNATDTEKPMDLMLISSLRFGAVLPPIDAWYAESTVSYYHLGHVMVDIAGRVAGLPVGIGFTFGVATAGALAGAAVFALAGDVLTLSRVQQRASVWVAGTVAVVSLLFLAPVEGFFELVSAHEIGAASIWARLGVSGFPGEPYIETGVPTQFWWWWRASRVLPEVITEFPAFSIILGDLHAHLLGLPLAVLAVAAVLPTFDGRMALTPTSWLWRPGALVVAGALFAGIFMTNAWDAALYGALWGVAGIAVFVNSGWPIHQTFFMTARFLFAPVLLALIIAAPFLSTLQSVPFGIAVVTDAGSDPVRLLLVWIPLLLPAVAGAMLLQPATNRTAWIAAAVIGGLAVAAWVVALVAGGSAGSLVTHGARWYVLAGLVASGAWASGGAARAIRERDTARAVWLGLVAVSAAIVLVTELAFLEDAFANRMNTVFKFWYATWLLLAVAGAVAVGMAYDRRALGRVGSLGLAGIAVMVVLYGGSLLYAPAAAAARAREGQDRGIDALAYLDRTDRGAAETARWAHANLRPRDVLLEAVGQDYSTGNVVSASSGVPTLLAWPGHQLTWRGNILGLATRRTAVSEIYHDLSLDEARAKAAEFGVTHVYLGREERAQFGEGVMARFVGWPVVFEADGSRTVAVPGADGR